MCLFQLCCCCYQGWITHCLVWPNWCVLQSNQHRAKRINTILRHTHANQDNKQYRPQEKKLKLKTECTNPNDANLGATHKFRSVVDFFAQLLAGADRNRMELRVTLRPENIYSLSLSPVRSRKVAVEREHGHRAVRARAWTLPFNSVQLEAQCTVVGRTV